MTYFRPRRLRGVLYLVTTSLVLLAFIYISRDEEWPSGSAENGIKREVLTLPVQEIERKAFARQRTGGIHIQEHLLVRDSLSTKQFVHNNVSDNYLSVQEHDSSITLKNNTPRYIIANGNVTSFCDDECERFKVFLKSWPPGKPKAAIYFLTKSARWQYLTKALETVDKYFNDKFHYPIIVFHEEEFARAKNAVRAITKSEVFFQTITFSIPAFLETPVPINIPCMSSISYRHMCRFHAKSVYEQAIIQDLEFYWRLDDDSLLLSPVKYDVFKYMKDNHIQYGYSWRHLDASSCVEGLWEATRTYIDQNNLTTFFFKSWRWPWIYYNNFEISQTKTWFSDQYKDYIDYLDRLGGIYYHRWGDAPIRGIAVSMFMPKAETHHFTDIGYQHRTYINSVSSGQ